MKTVRVASSKYDCAAAQLRFIAVSATIPNIEDIATWLDCSPECVLSFGEEYRPVKLEIHVVGYPRSNNDFIFDRNLNFKVFELIRQFSDGRPTLVFCSSRKGASQGAVQIAKDSAHLLSTTRRQTLLEASFRSGDAMLAECIRGGVGFHSAATSFQDRALVEDLFMKELLTALCTTSTLAQGVNLPAHLVIVKSTLYWTSGSGYEEASELDILQMIGRAGRPQFDTSAVAVIMTTQDSRQKWLNILSRKQVIESCLLQNLEEHLVSEIVLGSIADVAQAVLWLKSTFLYTRVKKKPQYYGMKTANTEDIERNLKEICMRDLNELASFGLITMDDDGFTVKATDRGAIMARYYVAVQTIKLFSEVDAQAELCDLLKTLAKATEFRDIRLRVTEKKLLNVVQLRFPLPHPSKVISDAEKIFVLLQAALSNHMFEEWGLKQDTSTVFSCCGRLCCSLIHTQLALRHFEAARNAIKLSQCLRARMWEDSRLVAKQIRVHLVFPSRRCCSWHRRHLCAHSCIERIRHCREATPVGPAPPRSGVRTETDIWQPDSGRRRAAAAAIAERGSKRRLRPPAGNPRRRRRGNRVCALRRLPRSRRRSRPSRLPQKAD
eukprot:TRINITY_DN1048_c0_g1_i1.p1 TRINITY_DN1048_c0_g1~~TRINITY_DN1048_c0_g1_i1.p1  ORF type:complete len:608 (+),score=102.51 TRINITY_DN1048_c0_g1_i1:889-2712(+)